MASIESVSVRFSNVTFAESVFLQNGDEFIDALGLFNGFGNVRGDIVFEVFAESQAEFVDFGREEGFVEIEEFDGIVDVGSLFGCQVGIYK